MRYKHQNEWDQVEEDGLDELECPRRGLGPVVVAVAIEDRVEAGLAQILRALGAQVNQVGPHNGKRNQPNDDNHALGLAEVRFEFEGMANGVVAVDGYCGERQHADGNGNVLAGSGAIVAKFLVRNLWPTLFLIRIRELDKLKLNFYRQHCHYHHHHHHAASVNMNAITREQPKICEIAPS